MDTRRRKRKKQYSPKRQRCSKAAYGQKNWKAQQGWKEKKGMLGECSKF